MGGRRYRARGARFGTNPDFMREVELFVHATAGRRALPLNSIPKEGVEIIKAVADTDVVSENPTPRV